MLCCDGKTLAYVHLYTCVPIVTKRPWPTRRQLLDLTPWASPTNRCARCRCQ
jgi:hypothetical protein